MATLAEKLQLKAGQRVAVLNASEGILTLLRADLGDTVVVAGAAGESDAVLLFVNNLAETAQLAPGAIQSAGTDGLLWISYPEGGSKIGTDVNRDRLWEAMVPTGWRPVRQIALDEVWSALRFRPAEQVGR